MIGRHALAVAGTLLLALFVATGVVEAQQTPAYRVGIITPGGSNYAAGVSGLKDGLRELGLEEGKQIIFHVRDLKGDVKSAAGAAASLEEEKVQIICTFGTSMTLAAMHGTKSVPIVFYAGTDPVVMRFAASYAKPGGRFTGVHSQNVDTVPKRLELLKDLVPRLRTVVIFYDPANPVVPRSLQAARTAGGKLNVEIVERPVASVEELRKALRALRPGEVDALFRLPDAMVNSDADYIVEVAAALKLPTMFYDREVVERGALASYGFSYHAIGKVLSTKVYRILKGANPGDLPIEQVDRIEFVLNLKTAKAIGLTIPKSLLDRVDEVIQ